MPQSNLPQGLTQVRSTQAKLDAQSLLLLHSDLVELIERIPVQIKCHININSRKINKIGTLIIFIPKMPVTNKVLK